MSRNDDCTKGNLVDFSYHQNYHKLISIDLSRQTNTSVSQQISFTEQLEDDDATIFSTAEKQQKLVLNVSLDSVIVTEYYK